MNKKLSVVVAFLMGILLTVVFTSPEFGIRRAEAFTVPILVLVEAKLDQIEAKLDRAEVKLDQLVANPGGG